MQKMMKPNPDEVRAARMSTGLSQKQAGESIGAPLKTWQSWESKTGEARQMPAAKFQLFKLVHKL
jgi:DNA-binding transcriptional regulator YiaG